MNDFTLLMTAVITGLLSGGAIALARNAISAGE